MTQQPSHGTSQSMTAMLAAVGIPVTEDGKVRARRRIAEAEDRFTPELREQARRQLGMPPRAAA